MYEPWVYAIWTLGAYLVGSISTGDIVTRAMGVNIRELGTGNPGTANIAREVGRRAGYSVFVLDVAKGTAITLPLLLLGQPTWGALPLVAAMLLGQFFPVFFRFRGGTGMAAAMGSTVGILPYGAVIGLVAGLAFLRSTRNVGWTGLVFFAVTVVAGGLLHWSWVGVVVVFIGAAAVFIRAKIQYGD